MKPGENCKIIYKDSSVSNSGSINGDINTGINISVEKEYPIAKTGKKFRSWVAAIISVSATLLAAIIQKMFKIF